MDLNEDELPLFEIQEEPPQQPPPPNEQNVTNAVPQLDLNDDLDLMLQQNVPPAPVPTANDTEVPIANRTRGRQPQQTSMNVVQQNDMILSTVQGPIDQSAAVQPVNGAPNQQTESVLVIGGNSLQTTSTRPRTDPLKKAIKRLGRNRVRYNPRRIKVC